MAKIATTPAITPMMRPVLDSLTIIMLLPFVLYSPTPLEPPETATELPLVLDTATAPEPPETATELPLVLDTATAPEPPETATAVDDEEDATTVV